MFKRALIVVALVGIQVSPASAGLVGSLGQLQESPALERLSPGMVIADTRDSAKTPTSGLPPSPAPPKTTRQGEGTDAKKCRRGRFGFDVEPERVP